MHIFFAKYATLNAINTLFIWSILIGLLFIFSHGEAQSMTVDSTHSWCEFKSEEIEGSKNIEDLLYKFHFSDAEKLIIAERNISAKKFYTTHLRFLEAFVHQDKYTYDRFYLSSIELEQYLDENPGTPNYYFMSCELLLERTIIKVIHQKLTSAILDLRECHSLVQDAKSEGKAEQVHRFSGIFFIAFSSVPKQYKWALELLGYHGNLQKGYSELLEAVRIGPLLRKENQIIQYFILRNLMANVPKTREHVTQLYRSDPDNILHVYLYAHNNIDSKNNTEALRAMKGFMESTKADYFPFLYNQYARACMFKQDYKVAIEYFTLYNKTFNGVIYKIDATFRKGVCYAILGDKQNALICFRQAAFDKRLVFDEDKYASKYANYHLKNYFTGNELLLNRARFYLDGGYNEEGKKILLVMLTPGFKLYNDEKVEIYYRLARMYDSLNDYKLAIEYFTLAIREESKFRRLIKATNQQPEISRHWMEVYSYLFAGIIHEKLKNFNESHRLFKVCLEFDDYDYQSGLEQKAKAGIERTKLYLKK